MLECRYKGQCCVMYHRPFDSDEIPCDGYDGDTCSLYEPMPDVKALKGLADEMEQETGSVCGVCMGWYARRIREALGVADA